VRRKSALTGPYPTLRVVGLEPADAPRREAIANIEAAGYSDRIEIRDQPVEALTDVEGFDLVYLPQVFLSEDAPSISTPPVLPDSTRPAASSLSVDLSAFAPLTGRIRTTLAYLSGTGVQTVIERSGIPRAEADQSPIIQRVRQSRRTQPLRPMRRLQDVRGHFNYPSTRRDVRRGAWRDSQAVRRLRWTYRPPNE
jgi:hypothetical protein